MSFWPVKIGSGKVEYAHSGVTTPTYSGDGVTITASATVNTKGAWVELDASTAFDVSMIEVTIMGTSASGTDTSMLVDIGVGAAASEQVVIPNLLGGSKSSIQYGTYRFPVRIPSGSRIAARCQSVVSSDTALVAVVLSELSPIEPGSEVITYGANTSLSAGTSVTSGNAVEGSWTEITSSTSAPIRWIAGGYQIGSGGGGNVEYWADLAIGASGSEQEIFTDFMLVHEASTENADWRGSGFPVNIPAGTRLALRVMGTNSKTRDWCLYGVS